MLLLASPRRVIHYPRSGLEPLSCRRLAVDTRLDLSWGLLMCFPWIIIFGNHNIYTKEQLRSAYVRMFLRVFTFCNVFRRNKYEIAIVLTSSRVAGSYPCWLRSSEVVCLNPPRDLGFITHKLFSVPSRTQLTRVPGNVMWNKSDRRDTYHVCDLFKLRLSCSQGNKCFFLCTIKLTICLLKYRSVTCI